MTKMIICKECNELKPHVAHGLCKKCYRRQYYIKNIDKSELVVCVKCGEEKPHRSNGLCKQCYNKLYRIKNRNVMNERSGQYYLDNHERLVDAAQQYRDDHPLLSFLGSRVRLKYHDRVPEGYVWHHTCYDHANPEANIVLLNQSSHKQGHALLRALDMEIPHINEDINHATV